MFPFARRAAVPAALLAVAACADHPTPAGPSRDRPPDPPAGLSPGPSLLQARNEVLARRFAIALRDDEFRAKVVRALRTSKDPEGKVYLQGFLSADRGAVRHRLAELSGDSDSQIAADLSQSPQIEIYLPVPEHRMRWRGDLNVVVATAERDRDAPVAFDPRGRRQLLDPDRPPAVPVIALGRAETRFAEPGLVHSECMTCFNDPGEGTGGGQAGGPAAPVVTPGLYMTYATFTQEFEGWLKGKPEFEVHILGQDGSSTAMKSYQCAGEKAGGPYRFDQNEKTWTGSVLLFSQAQLDAYKAAHPTQAIRVFVLEDDDESCVIKTDSARVDKMFKQLQVTYGDLTGGKDSTIFAVRIFKKAFSILSLFKTFWSFITTADDIVGTAIEDGAAAAFHPSANWLVKGENTITHGAIRLEMR